MLSCVSFVLHTLRVTHQPTLNSTWASNRATTGAVAALHPLTLDRIRPSCLECRTILMKPGRLLFVSDTKSISFSFRSSRNTHRHAHTYEFHIKYLKSFLKVAHELGEESDSCLVWANFHPQDASMSSSSGQYFIGGRPKVLMLHCSDHWTKEAAACASTADLHGAYQS